MGKKDQRLRAALQRLAEAELGEDSEGIDFVVARVSVGQTITSLARDIAAEMGESASRNWVSWRVNHLPTPEGTATAKERIALARKDAAAALAEQALEISDEPCESTVDVQRGRLRADTRLALAKAFDAGTFADRPSVAIQIVSAGAAHLAALRHRALDAKTRRALPPSTAQLPPPDDESADYEIVKSPSEEKLDQLLR